MLYLLFLLWQFRIGSSGSAWYGGGGGGDGDGIRIGCFSIPPVGLAGDIHVFHTILICIL